MPLQSLLHNRFKYNVLNSYLDGKSLRGLPMANTHVPSSEDNTLADVVSGRASGTNVSVVDVTGLTIAQNDTEHYASADATNPSITDVDPATAIPGLETYIRTTDTVSVDAVNQGTKTFTLTGLAGSSDFFDGALFAISGSTGNDGTYTVASSADNSSDLDVTVEEAIPDGTADGTVTYDDISECELFFYGLIADTDTDTIDGVSGNVITINGVDLTDDLHDGAVFTITGSTDLDGTYMVKSSQFTGGNTEVTTAQDLPGTTADGTVTYIDVSTGPDPDSNTITFDLFNPMFIIR